MTKTVEERMAVVETQVTVIAEDVKEIKASLAGLDNKYASKWVQTAVSFVVGLLVAGVITGLLAFVINKPVTTTTTITPTPVQIQTQ